MPLSLGTIRRTIVRKSMSDQIKVPIVSFFSGAGGLDYGFSRERFRVLLACDNFPSAVASYNFNAKRKIARHIDLSDVEPEELCDAIDAVSPNCPPEGIVGGPPCQATP